MHPADLQAPETIDHVAATTAHELSHQWWAHQITGADMEGSMVLSETLAIYSAMVMLRKLAGEHQFRRGLHHRLDRYLAGRAVGGCEPPRILVGGQTWVGYDEGRLAVYLLHERLGEDRVDPALRSLPQRYRCKDAPYPRSLDLVAALRAEARTTEEQDPITDLVERVILYELKVTAPTAVRRADGRWDVAVPVEARRHRVDGRGAEAETALAERMEVRLFTADPGTGALDARHAIAMGRQPIRTGAQVLKFVTDRRPTHAGIAPHNRYIDRNPRDDVRPLAGAGRGQR